MQTLRNIKSSAAELKSLHALAICAVMLALRVALGFIAVGTDTIRVSIANLPVYIVAFIFGPLPGAIVGALGDIVTLIVKPTGPLNLGITFSEMMVGFIAGLFLYRRRIRLARTICSCVTVAVVCSLGITTLSILAVYPVSAPWIMFGTRAITAAITTPIVTALLYGAQKALERIPLPHVSIVK